MNKATLFHGGQFHPSINDEYSHTYIGEEMEEERRWEGGCQRETSFYQGGTLRETESLAQGFVIPPTHTLCTCVTLCTAFTAQTKALVSSEIAS